MEPGLTARHQATAGAAARRADRLPAPGAAGRHRLPHRCRLVSAARQLLCGAWEPVPRSQRRHVTYACTCMSCSGRISSLLWAALPVVCCELLIVVSTAKPDIGMLETTNQELRAAHAKPYEIMNRWPGSR